MLDVEVRLARGNFRLEVAGRFDRRVTGVFGESGAGKTSLLHVIAGLTRPDAGRVVLDGRILLDTASRIDRPPHARRVGLVFQESRLFPHLSVRGNLDYGRRRRPASERRFEPGPIAELLELTPLLDRRVRHLSGGERQRVALGRAILSSPRILLLDEPLASLDRALKRQILPLLRRVRDTLDIPMLHVSHDLTEILQLTTDLMILESGRVIGHGRYTDLALDRRALARETDLVNVIEARVAESDEVGGTTTLVLGRSGDPSAIRLLGPRSETPIGGRVMASVRPEDVALARHPIEGISIQNQIPGRVARIAETGGHALVEVDVGVPLLAVVGPRMIGEMGVAVDARVWCLIKVNAIKYPG